jgi:alpha-tubulin suppressor-like RCC1 family protein
MELLTGVQRVATGGMFSCALLATGRVRCWGSKILGELGDGSATTGRASPPTTDVPICS